MAGVIVVIVRVQRHGAREIPAAEFGDAADDVDALAPFGADLHGEGERDGFGVLAGGGGCEGDAEAGAAGGGFAVAAGVDLVFVLEGVDGAVVGLGGGVADLEGVVEGGGGDGLGGFVVAGMGEGLGTIADVLGWKMGLGTYMVSVKFCFTAREKLPML